MSDWELQQRHLQTHNLFYSTVHGEVDQSLADLNYHVVGEFTVVENRKKGARCQPAFTLYNNNNLIFVDIAEPGRLTESEIDRLGQYNNLDRESVEDYLDRCEFSNPAYNKSALDNFDSCFIMRAEQYNSHKSGPPDLQKKIDRLEMEGCILTLSPGEELIKRNRGIHADRVDDVITTGVNIPEKTGKYIHLPQNITQETLSVAICEEMIAGGDLRDGISIQESDVGDYFGREISYDLVNRVLKYLRKINACRIKRGENKYTFTSYNLKTILSIRNKLVSDPIDEVLSDDEHPSLDNNRSLSEFS